MADTTAMSDADTTRASTSDADDDGHGHGPPGEPLGPIDWTLWAYAAAGAAFGLVVALALFIAKGT